MTSHQFDLELILNWLKPLFVGVLLLIEGLLSFLKKKKHLFHIMFSNQTSGKIQNHYWHGSIVAIHPRGSIVSVIHMDK